MSLTAESIKSPFLPDCLAGKVVLVTGGGSGIGYEITRQLLLHGVSGAVICGRREAFLQRAAKMLEQDVAKNSGQNQWVVQVDYQVCDVRDAQTCQRAVDYTVQKFGKLDILVNCAAGNFLVEARALSPKGFATVMGIDAQGTFNMSRCAYDALSSNAKNDESIIINISATLQYGATWWQSHASAAKSAVDSLTRSLALEWGSDSIRVVGIAPGPIADTPGTTKLAPGMTIAEAEEMVQDGIPLGRMGRSKEIGLAAVFLCSSGAKYITGDVLVVDGAQYLWKPPMVPKEMVSELSRGVEAKSRAQAPTRSKL